MQGERRAEHRAPGATQPERFSIPLSGGAIAGWRWPADAPPLLFCHANGFCASTYRRMLGELAGCFDIHAIDLRGHGRTALACDPAALKSWKPYADDIGGALDRLNAEERRAWRLAGHSLGATSALLAARGRSDIAAVALIEPVAPPAVYAILGASPLWPFLAGRLPLVRGALARRAVFPDRDAAKAAYARKPLFSRWADGCLDDYLLDGLVDEAGVVRLSCRPDWEAATFAAQGSRFREALKAAPRPLSILAADHRTSTVYPRSARWFARLGVKVERAAGGTHFLPMEAPREAAAFLAKALSGKDLE
jgi:pimeloyl-ACP methyl ester carboxylesterase